MLMLEFVPYLEKLNMKLIDIIPELDVIWFTVGIESEDDREIPDVKFTFI